MKQTYDVAVIGGGPAGYIAAIKASQLGGRVVLFEKDTVGGTCLNRGCIPTKTYLKTAEYIQHIKHAKTRGIHLKSTDFTLDMGEVVAGKNQVVRQLTGGVAGLLKSYGVDVVKASAGLKSATQVLADGTVYEAKNIILCGGSKAGILPIPGAADNADVVTSDGILELTELPKRLAVIGGGVIGCEMACAFQSFGSQVTIIELADRLVPTMDKDVSAELRKSLEQQGVKVLTAQKVAQIAKHEGVSAVFLAGQADPIPADKILLSTGRVADLECLGELKDRIKVEQGKIAVDAQMRTNIPNIYAAGDVNGKYMLAHAAFKMGETAAANAMGHKEICDLSHVPGCLYTLPEAASVGMTEEEARKSYDVSIGMFPFRANGRSLASGETTGFVKVIVDKKYGEILGAHIVGACATELIQEVVNLMAMEITAHEAADVVHGHPTYAEAIMEACADALGRCLHLPPKKRI